MQDDIQSYPLCWPPGWRRTNCREYSRFGKKRDGSWGKRDITINEAVRFTLDEIERMGIPNSRVIISSDLRLRLDGLPVSGQGEPADRGVAVWWKEGKAWRVIALDKYTRIADNIYAVGKTIEALRGIERWGSGEILDRTFTGFAALAHLPTNDWYVVLGVDRNADVATVEAAYKRRRSETHPDKLEGSKVAFQEVQDAWERFLKERGR